MVAILQEQRKNALAELAKVQSETKDANKSSVDMGKEVTDLKAQAKSLDDRVKTWDARLWVLVTLLISAILSLASGLIVALTRK